MTLAEKLTEVGNNRPKLYNKGALDYSPQETVSGEAIGITDISPIEHNMGVSVRGKNLINNTLKSQTINGVTVTVNDDKSVTLNGTCTKETYLKVNENLNLAKGTYVLTRNSFSTGTTSGIYVDLPNDANRYFFEWGASYCFTLNEEQNGVVILVLRVGTVFDNITYYPMLNEGTVALPYAPYIEDISTVKLYKGGKNLVKFPDSRPNLNDITYEAGQTQTHNGITYTVQEDGGIYAVGTVTGTYSSFIFAKDNYFGDLPYQFPYNGSINGGANGASKGGVSASKRLYWQGDGKRNLLYLYFTSGTTVDEVFYPQLEFSNAPTKYEPYIEPTVYDVQSDGIVEGVKSLYPNTTLYTDTQGAVIDCTYYQDGRKVKENLTDMILSLGGIINE